MLSGAYAVSVVLFLGWFSPLRGTFFSVTDFEKRPTNYWSFVTLNTPHTSKKRLRKSKDPLVVLSTTGDLSAFVAPENSKEGPVHARSVGLRGLKSPSQNKGRYYYLRNSRWKGVYFIWLEHSGRSSSSFQPNTNSGDLLSLALAQEKEDASISISILDWKALFFLDSWLRTWWTRRNWKRKRKS